MKGWLVDTNVLLDVIGADPVFGESSRLALEDCAAAGVLVVNPVIVAEVAAVVETLEELGELFPEDLFRQDDLPHEAAFLAGRAFARYRRAGGMKERMLADFLIGAHAAVSGLGLVSRDRGYLSYFELELLDPSP